MIRIVAFVAAFTLCAVITAAQTSYKRDIPARLAKQAKIDEQTAAAAARAHLPTGTIKSVELEREHGALIYSYDLIVPGKKGVEEVNVDAMTGKIVSTEHESAAAERNEAAAKKSSK